MISGKALEFYENEEPPSEEIREFIDEEIAHTPHAPHSLAAKLEQHHSTSPADAGGDVDAAWEESGDDGSEAFAGHNPTPDQSNVEENAHAMGIDFEDNEPLDFVEKIDKRDRDRFELKETSKTGHDTI
jgi:hypothetical protein